MDYLPLVLGVNRRAGGEPPPAVIQAIKSQVLERDDYTCRYCGFKAKRYQEIQFRDGNFRNQTDDNTATACIFCYQCMNLDRAAAMNSGLLIWCPEIDQPTLHHIARGIYVARRTQGPIADAARGALAALTKRKDDAVQRLGTDSPKLLAAVMRDLLDGKSYQRREQKLEGIRLLPLDRRIIKEDDMEFDQFQQIVAFWRSRYGPFGSLLPPTWPQLLQSAIEKQAA